MTMVLWWKLVNLIDLRPCLILDANSNIIIKIASLVGESLCWICVFYSAELRARASIFCYVRTSGSL